MQLLHESWESPDAGTGRTPKGCSACSGLKLSSWVVSRPPVGLARTKDWKSGKASREDNPRGGSDACMPAGPECVTGLRDIQYATLNSACKATPMRRFSACSTLRPGPAPRTWNCFEPATSPPSKISHWSWKGRADKEIALIACWFFYHTRHTIFKYDSKLTISSFDKHLHYFW